MNNINKLHYALNAYEMQKLNPDAKIITYDDLNKVFNINDLFKDTNKLIILYLLQSKTSGHWVTLFKSRDGIFHYFDSYGEEEDFHLDNLTHAQRAEYDEKQKRLKLLLRNEKVFFNNVRMQSKGTSTCGHFVTHRLHYSDLNEADYIKLFIDNDIDKPDEYVAEYVLYLLMHLKK